MAIICKLFIVFYVEIFIEKSIMLNSISSNYVKLL